MAAAGCTGVPPSSNSSGRAVFEQHCAACHAIACNRVGPRLAGVVGRAAGAVLDFNGYSVEMRYSGILWTPERLDALVSAPETVVHLSWMEALDPVPDAAGRAALIAFLQSGDTSADRCGTSPAGGAGAAGATSD